eukprot:135750_1
MFTMSEEEQNFIKLVVVGDGATGKTCLLIRYCQDEFPTDYIPTLFENITICKVLNINNEDMVIDLDLWDTAGQSEIFDRLRPLVYRETDIFLLCFSIANRSSLENIATRWEPEVNHHCPDGIKILVGLKADLNETLYDHELLVYGYIHQLNFTRLNILNDIIDIILLFERGKQPLYVSNIISAYDRHNPITMEYINEMKDRCNCIEYVQTSALNGTNVTELFETVAIKAHLNRCTISTNPGIQVVGCNCKLL